MPPEFTEMNLPFFCRAGAYEEKNLKKLLKDIFLAVEKDIYHIQSLFRNYIIKVCWRVCSDGPGYPGSYHD